MTRRPVVPDAAGRSLWFAAVWTGVGAAVVCATVGIAAVAICWMPAAGASGHATSTIRAGLLTFLSALHGGLTVDGTAAAFLPLGMLVVVGVTAWRAGAGLADAAGALDERDPVRLALAAGLQVAGFSVACLVAVPFSRLGTSSVPLVGVALASLTLFAVTGGVSFVRSSPLAGRVGASLPPAAAVVVRAAAAAVCVYVGAGALLVAGALVVHHAQVDRLAAQVGGGWAGVPVLLLGVLAAPNAVVAGSAYLAGPGFSVGAGTTASAFGTAHGVVPAFPLLGALPIGSGATPAVWVLMAVTPVLAGLAVSRVVGPAASWRERLLLCAGAAPVAGFALAVLAWQAGGGIGPGRLATVGASPVLTGSAVTAGVAVGTGLVLGVGFARAWVGKVFGAEPVGDELRASAAVDTPDDVDTARLTVVVEADDTAAPDADRAGKLAG